MPDEFVEFFAYEKVGYACPNAVEERVYRVPPDQVAQFAAAWNEAYPGSTITPAPGATLTIRVPADDDPFEELAKELL